MWSENNVFFVRELLFVATLLEKILTRYSLKPDTIKTEAWKFAYFYLPLKRKIYINQRYLKGGRTVFETLP